MACSKPPLAESIFVVEVAESLVLAARTENTIAKAVAITEWPTTVQPSITGVVTINEYSAFPTLVVTQGTTSTLRHRNSRQRHKQKSAHHY
jgi:hypothetical protein